MAERALANAESCLKWNRVVDEVLGDDKDGVTGVRLTSTVGDRAGRPVGGRPVPGDRPHAEHRLPGRPVGPDRHRLRQVDDAAANLHERGGRLRGRRRGRRLLPAGGVRPPAPAAWPPWTPSAGWPAGAITERLVRGRYGS